MKTTTIPHNHDTVGSRSLEALLRNGEDAFTDVIGQIGRGDEPSLLEQPQFIALCDQLNAIPAFREFSDRFDVDRYAGALMLFITERLYFDQSPPTTGRRFRRSHRAA